MRSNIETAILSDCLLVERTRLGMTVASSTGLDVTLPAKCMPIVRVDGDTAARNVLMPDEASNKGTFLYVINNSSFALTAQGSTGGSLTGGDVVIDEQETLCMICDGTAWRSVKGTT